MERNIYESGSNREKKEVPIRRAFLPMPEDMMFYQREEATRAAESVKVESEKESKTTDKESGKEQKMPAAPVEQEKKIVPSSVVLESVINPTFEAEPEKEQNLEKLEASEELESLEQNFAPETMPVVSGQLEELNSATQQEGRLPELPDQPENTEFTPTVFRPELTSENTPETSGAESQVQQSSEVNYPQPPVETQPVYEIHEQPHFQNEVPRAPINPFIEQTIFSPNEPQPQHEQAQFTTPVAAPKPEARHFEMPVMKLPTTEVAAVFGGALATVEMAHHKREAKTMNRRLKRFLRLDRKEKINQREANKEMLAKQSETLAEQKKQTAELRKMRQMQEQKPEIISAQPTKIEPIPALVLPTREQVATARIERPAPTIFTPEANPEKPPQPAAVNKAETQNEQTVVYQPDQHLEKSAWHNIIVDKHGREVEGAIEYGEGFQRERKQEAAQFYAAQDLTDLGGAQSLGTVSSDFTGSSSLPSGMTTPTLPAGESNVDAQHRLLEHEPPQQQHTVAAPVIWIMIVIILAVFFAAAFI